MRFVHRYVVAAVYAVTYALLLWGAFALAGTPRYMQGHTFDVLSLVFVATLFAHAQGQSVGEDRR